MSDVIGARVPGWSRLRAALMSGVVTFVALFLVWLAAMGDRRAWLS